MTPLTARMWANHDCRPGSYERHEMALLTQTPYKARNFDLSGLTGISDNTLEVHFGLYGGYVKNVNLLNEQLVTMQSAGQSSNPAYAELTRRLGFEYNGMVLQPGGVRTG